MIQWLCGGRHGGPSEGRSLPSPWGFVDEGGAERLDQDRSGAERIGTELRRKGPACLAGAAGRLFSTLKGSALDPPSKSDNCKEDKKRELSDEDAFLILSIARFGSFLTPSRPTWPSVTQLPALLRPSSRVTSSPNDGLPTWLGSLCIFAASPWPERSKLRRRF